MHINGYDNGHRARSYPQQSNEIRYPDESWQVGESEIVASAWYARGRNQGDQYLDLRRVKDDGTQLKTFRPSDITSFYQGLAEHCSRLSEQEELTDEERDVYAALAEGTVELLDGVPRLEKAPRKPKRKKRTRRS